jgi:hypothetical protein
MVGPSKITFAPHPSQLLECRVVDTNDVVLATIATPTPRPAWFRAAAGDGIDSHEPTPSSLQHYEYWHLMDASFVFATAPHLIRSLAGPPPGLEVVVTQRCDRVVGQLMRPLIVSIPTKVYGGNHVSANKTIAVTTWKTVHLTNVLVVQDLPVPLYLAREWGDAVDAAPTKIRRGGWTKEAFPDSYHNHPYWTTAHWTTVTAHLTAAHLKPNPGLPRHSPHVSVTASAAAAVDGVDGALEISPRSQRLRWKRRMSM